MRNKNIRKERVEEDFAIIAKSLTPRPQLLLAAKAMFCKIWDARLNGLKQQRSAGLKSAYAIDKKISQLVERIMNATNNHVVAAYEKEVAGLEKQKRLLTNTANKPLESAQPFEIAFKAAMEFLAMPWKLWESGDYAQQRLLLKLALPEPLPYCRENGWLNRNLSLPFKVLGGFNMLKNEMVEPRGVEPLTSSLPAKRSTS